MAALEVYQLTSRYTFDGQLCENVFFYTNSAGGPNSADQLFGAFVADVLPAILDIQNAAVAMQDITVINLDNPLDFFEGGSVLAGTAVGDFEPPFVAWAFRYNRLSRDSHNGAKRIAGVTTAQVVDGVATGAALALLATAALALQANIINGGTTFSPLIFRRPSEAYPLGVAFRVGTVDYVRVSSQASRKVTS